MKRISYSGILLAILAALCFNSCKNDLISAPTRNTEDEKNLSDYKDSILPPETLQASQGNKGNITLTWKKVENATSYRIYEGDTPFENLKLKTETGDTTKVMEYGAGTTKYFAVTAINYYGTESLLSKTTMGSVLAVPVITHIESNRPGEYTLTWWMDNCNKDTYEKDLQYTINVYVDNKPATQACMTVPELEGSLRTHTISGLTDNPDYWFDVQAALKTADGETQQKESSGRTNAKSAKKVSPDAVKDFAVSKEISPEYITVEWQLPEAVWFKTEDYELHPVYFKLYRKLATEYDFTLLETIGAKSTEDWKTPGSKSILFDCETNTVTDKDGTSIDYAAIEKAEGGKTLPNYYSGYTSGSKFIYLDKTADRGKYYDYFVEAYTDDTVKVIPEKDTVEYKESITEPLSGCTLSPISFQTAHQLVVNETEPNKIDKVILTFTLEYASQEEEDSEYKYVILQNKTSFTSDVPETSILTGPEALTKTTEEPLEIVYEYTISDTSLEGYYTYDLYIVSPEYTAEALPDSTNTVEKLIGASTVTIVGEKTRLPEITTFTVEDGYKDHFVLSWNHTPDSIYTVSWFPVVNGIDKTESTESKTLEETDYTLDEGTNLITYTHEAASGDVRKYSLTVEKDIKIQKALSTPFQTLGTVVPHFTEYNYDSIVTTWKPVSGIPDASGFTVSAVYDGNDAQLVTADNTAIEYVENSDVYKCTVYQPEGYNDYKKSGKKILLKVTATNSKDSTESEEITVRTLGPAEITTSANTAVEKEELKFSWTKAEGADKYLIHRILYSNKDCIDVETETGTIAAIIQSDSFIVDAETLEVTTEANQSSEGRSRVILNKAGDTFTLIDKQKDADEDYEYQHTQSMIQWGLPYSYVVFPLKKEYEAENTRDRKEINYYSVFTFDKEEMKDDSVVIYSDYIADTKKTVNTAGYGINLKAEKSMNGETINITWSKPNNSLDLQPAIYRKPFTNTNGENWKKIANLSTNAQSYKDKIPNDKAHLAFVYAVEYEPRTECSFAASYINDISKVSEGFTEEDNKGYLFSIKGLNAYFIKSDIDSPDYFQENLRWDSSWDFEERAICPQSFTVDILNKNLSRTKDWITIAEVTIDSTTGRFSITPKDEYKVDAAMNEDDLTVIPAGADNGINILPRSLSTSKKPVKAEGESDSDFAARLNQYKSDGLLSVLRDTRHYYSLNISGNGSESRQAKDGSIFTYRQLTEIELVKCINVIIADAMYQNAIPFLPGSLGAGQTYKTTGINGNSGEFQLSVYGGGTKFWTGNRISWGFNNSEYNHKFASGISSAFRGSFNSDFIITSDNTSYVVGVNEFSLYHLPQLTLTVKHKEDDLTSCDKDIVITVGAEGTSKKESLNIVIKNKEANETLYTIDISNDHEKFTEYFPFALGTRTEYVITNPESDNASSTPIYQGPWWN